MRVHTKALLAMPQQEEMSGDAALELITQHNTESNIFQLNSRTRWK